jgi:hypothetical protein
MIPFEIFVNGHKRFTAGGDYQTLVTSLTHVRTAPSEHVLIFNTSGIEPEPLSVAHWPECDVRVGDRIEIRVVEAGSADPPARVDDHESEQDES